jgi:hypothetical protein
MFVLIVLLLIVAVLLGWSELRRLLAVVHSRRRGDPPSARLLRGRRDERSRRWTQAPAAVWALMSESQAFSRRAAGTAGRSSGAAADWSACPRGRTGRFGLRIASYFLQGSVRDCGSDGNIGAGVVAGAGP